MKLEIFFDYVCPYCYHGHQYIIELIKDNPKFEIIWIPVEAHPRPEYAPVHSDLAIQGMLWIEENGGDIWEYHRAVYESTFEKHEDVSDLEVLKKCAIRAGSAPDAFAKTISGNLYQDRVIQNNHYAWETRALYAVPSFYANGQTIGSRDGVLVSQKELSRFLMTI